LSLTCAAALAAGSALPGTVDVLRQASFLTGGVANVATLGAFVVGAATVLDRGVLPGPGTRWFGIVAGGLAILSVLSLVFYHATVLLPVGRVLSMAWTVVAGIRLRRTAAGSR
jgi:hypothetical protein